RTYPFFWGYISYGLSALSGLPLVNTNTLLVPYYLLYISSTFLLIKILLENYNKKIVLLSTIFTIILQGYQFESFYLYKLFSFSILNLCLFLFIAILKEKNLDDMLSLERGATPSERSFLTSYFLIGFLLMISFLIYVFPLFVALAFILVYALVAGAERRPDYLKALTRILASAFVFYLLFDIVTELHVSEMILSQFGRFFQMSEIFKIVEILHFENIIYILFIFVIFLLLLIEKLFLKISRRPLQFKFKTKSSLKLKRTYLIVISVLMLIFVIDLVYRMVFFINLYNQILPYQISQQYDACFLFITSVLFIIILALFFLSFNTRKSNMRFFKIYFIMLLSIIFLYILCIIYYFNSFISRFVNFNSLDNKEIVFILSRLSVFICPFSSFFTSYFISFNLSPLNINFYVLIIDIMIFCFNVIGFGSIFLSYYVVKRDKKLFKILISWIIIIFILLSSYILYEWSTNYSSGLSEISGDSYMNIYYWIWRLLGYISFPLGIFASIGIFELSKYFKKKKIKRYKEVKYCMSYFVLSIVLISFLSQPIVLYNDHARYKEMNDQDIRLLRWISENIPDDTRVILDDFKFKYFLSFRSLTYCGSVIGTDKVFKKGGYSQAEFEAQVNFFIVNNYHYLVVSSVFFNNYYNISCFINRFYNQSLYQDGDMEIFFASF
ncbi:MAG: hypothetical protein JW891_06565, partial [Candidatus Lokiarchaeota archaeon]|nr:hypothetical protein [Candidatus Lokiarchaeota archaeon]